LVDLIDEFNMMNIDRFSLDDFTDADAMAIGILASGVTEVPDLN
ncbi:MAG: biopolymer transporter ExbD, partial [Chlorobium sp.]|nr:biopolymer transporter ExbD [Chlorobium sp.]